MEKAVEFCTLMKKGDRMISFDVQSGYRHLRIHPDILDYFCFRYNGRFYQCLALPFGWGPSGYWFGKLMAPVVRRIRSWGYLVLSYVDDFLVVPKRYAMATSRDCRRASARISILLNRLGIIRHREKGVWGSGEQVIEHLGFIFDTNQMIIMVPEEKRRCIRNISRTLLQEARCGRRWVSMRTLSRFLGKATSLMLAVPLARFYNRALYQSLNRKWKSIGGKLRVRLNAQAVRDLKYWQKLGPSGRPMHPPVADMTIHSDASDLGWGGTISSRGDDAAGDCGEVSLQGVWELPELRHTIMWRELFGMYRTIDKAADIADMAGRSADTVLRLRVYQDNSACRYIVRNMVTASDEAMPLLRRLQRLLEVRRVGIDVLWLPSAANLHADRLSRTWNPKDLQMSRRVLRLVSGWFSGQEVKPSFRYRRFSLEPPVAQRKTTIAALLDNWSDGRARIFNPPFDLVSLTLLKIAREGAKGVIVLPNWPNQIWYPAACAMIQNWIQLQHVGREAIVGHRRVNPKWRVMAGLVNMDPKGLQIEHPIFE